LLSYEEKLGLLSKKRELLKIAEKVDGEISTQIKRVIGD
jgi:predicted DNA-binding protein YlxM (UPF0122 family)